MTFFDWVSSISKAIDDKLVRETVYREAHMLEVNWEPIIWLLIGITEPSVQDFVAELMKGQENDVDLIVEMLREEHEYNRENLNESMVMLYLVLKAFGKISNKLHMDLLSEFCQQKDKMKVLRFFCRIQRFSDYSGDCMEAFHMNWKEFCRTTGLKSTVTFVMNEFYQRPNFEEMMDIGDGAHTIVFCRDLGNEKGLEESKKTVDHAYNRLPPNFSFSVASANINKQYKTGVKRAGMSFCGDLALVIDQEKMTGGSVSVIRHSNNALGRDRLTTGVDIFCKHARSVAYRNHRVDRNIRGSDLISRPDNISTLNDSHCNVMTDVLLSIILPANEELEKGSWNDSVMWIIILVRTIECILNPPGDWHIVCDIMHDFVVRTRQLRGHPYKDKIWKVAAPLLIELQKKYTKQGDKDMESFVANVHLHRKTDAPGCDLDNADADMLGLWHVQGYTKHAMLNDIINQGHDEAYTHTSIFHTVERFVILYEELRKLDAFTRTEDLCQEHSIVFKELTN